jgi:hypothetical protein
MGAVELLHAYLGGRLEVELLEPAPAVPCVPLPLPQDQTSGIMVLDEAVAEASRSPASRQRS